MEIIIALVLGITIAVLFVAGMKKTRIVGGGKMPTQQSFDQTPPALLKRMHEELQKHNKIGAIKIYKEETGVDLATAKNAVEAIEDKRFKVNE